MTPQKQMEIIKWGENHGAVDTVGFQPGHWVNNDGMAVSLRYIDTSDEVGYLIYWAVRAVDIWLYRMGVRYS